MEEAVAVVGVAGVVGVAVITEEEVLVIVAEAVDVSWPWLDATEVDAVSLLSSELDPFLRDECK